MYQVYIYVAVSFGIGDFRLACFLSPESTRSQKYTRYIIHERKVARHPFIFHLRSISISSHLCFFEASSPHLSVPLAEGHPSVRTFLHCSVLPILSLFPEKSAREVLAGRRISQKRQRSEKKGTIAARLLSLFLEASQ